MKARAEMGREEEGYVTPDLSYYWEGAREEWCEDNKWDEKNVATVYYYYHTQHPYPFSGCLYLYVSILLSRRKILTDYLFLTQ